MCHEISHWYASIPTSQGVQDVVIATVCVEKFDLYMICCLSLLSKRGSLYQIFEHITLYMLCAATNELYVSNHKLYNNFLTCCIYFL
ncbi:hypothetical protein Y032_0473g2100 [Ancylostoma ceylanicum]|nr:hypothetical protein Y032_0473g2100 [Ancylostoma ceylanicum]